MTTLQHNAAKALIDTMTEEQLIRVMRRMRHQKAAFPDIRDAIAQSVADELDSIAYNSQSQARIGYQPDDPGHEEFPEPHVGHFAGWLTAAIWVTAIVASWTIVYVVLIEVVLR